MILSKLLSRVFVSGRLVIEKFDREGNTTIILDDSNLVVSQANEVFAKLLAGEAQKDLIVKWIQLGNGGHDPANPKKPIPPSPSDTSLKSPLPSKEALLETTYTFPTPTSVQFVATLPLNSGLDGLTISEYGLLTANKFLVARKTSGELPKLAGFGLRFKWTIVFAGG